MRATGAARHANRACRWKTALSARWNYLGRPRGFHLDCALAQRAKSLLRRAGDRKPYSTALRGRRSLRRTGGAFRHSVLPFRPPKLFARQAWFECRAAPERHPDGREKRAETTPAKRPVGAPTGTGEKNKKARKNLASRTTNRAAMSACVGAWQESPYNRRPPSTPKA